MGTGRDSLHNVEQVHAIRRGESKAPIRAANIAQMEIPQQSNRQSNRSCEEACRQFARAGRI